MTRKDFDARVSDVMTKAMEMGLWKDGHLESTRVALAVRRQVANTPKLRECTPESIARAALDAHLAGLMPDGHEGYLVPVWNKKLPGGGGYEAHFRTSWRGAQAVACEEGNFRSVTAEVVRRGDHFRWTAGLAPTLEHEPKLNLTGADAEIIAAYAVGFPNDGGDPHFVVIDQADIEAARLTGGPTWKTHPAAMSRKTAVFRLTDRVIPRKTTRARLAALQAAEGRIHEIGTADATSPDGTSDRARQLTAATSGPAPESAEKPPIQDAEVVDEQTGEVRESVGFAGKPGYKGATQAEAEAGPTEAELEADRAADAINAKMRLYRKQKMSDKNKWSALAGEAEAAGLIFDEHQGEYRRPG